MCRRHNDPKYFCIKLNGGNKGFRRRVVDKYLTSTVSNRDKIIVSEIRIRRPMGTRTKKKVENGNWGGVRGWCT